MTTGRTMGEVIPNTDVPLFKDDLILKFCVQMILLSTMTLLHQQKITKMSVMRNKLNTDKLILLHLE